MKRDGLGGSQRKLGMIFEEQKTESSPLAALLFEIHFVETSNRPIASLQSPVCLSAPFRVHRKIRKLSFTTPQRWDKMVYNRVLLVAQQNKKYHT